MKRAVLLTLCLLAVPALLAASYLFDRKRSIIDRLHEAGW